MPMEDFSKLFEGIGICKIRENAKYNSIKVDIS